MPELNYGDQGRGVGAERRAGPQVEDTVKAGFGSSLAEHRRAGAKLPVAQQFRSSACQKEGLPVFGITYPCERTQTS